LLCRVKEKHIDLIWWDRNSDREVLGLCLGAFFGLGVVSSRFNETACEGVHVSMVRVALLLVNVDLVTLEGGEVRVEFLGR